jgi:hypothetical protein
MAYLQQLFFGLRNGSDFGHHNAAPVGSTWQISSPVILLLPILG